MTTSLPHRPIMLTALVLLVAACTTGATVPQTANGIVDVLEDAAVVTCRERREPVPDVVTCEDDDAGDVTVGITDTPLVTVEATSRSAPGPWVVGDTYVVITFEDDVAHAQAVRDAIGSGELYTVDDEGSARVLD